MQKKILLAVGIGVLYMTSSAIFLVADVRAQTSACQKVDLGDPGYTLLSDDLLNGYFRGNSVFARPAPRIKIVFVRGKDANIDDNKFNKLINLSIDGFRTIDPYASYFKLPRTWQVPLGVTVQLAYTFDFYYDQTPIDDGQFSISQRPGTEGVFSSDTDATVRSRSSCGNADLYIVFHGRQSVADAAAGYSSAFNRGYIYLWGDLLSSYSESNFSRIVIHESGHAFAGLSDEYLYSKEGIISRILPETWFRRENCSLFPRVDYRGPDNRVYGAGFGGCSFIQPGMQSPKDDPKYYFRPSPTSIMLDQGLYFQFNVVSCGYIVSAILGEPLDKSHARMHWPEQDKEYPWLDGCMAMNTTKDGIPSLNPQAKIASVSEGSVKVGTNTVVAPNGAVSISGSNFTSLSNTVQFSNGVGSGGVKYSNPVEIESLQSADDKTLSFTVPGSIAPTNGETYRTYELRIGAFNSDWSDPIKVTVTSVVPNPQLMLTSDTNKVIKGAQVTYAWNSQFADSCTGTEQIGVRSIPLNNLNLSGTAKSDPIDQNATITMTCSYGGQTVTKNLDIGIGSAPQVTINVTPATIRYGDVATLSWNSTNTDKCVGDVNPQNRVDGEVLSYQFEQYGIPKSWMNPAISGTMNLPQFYGKIDITFVLTCTGLGATKTSQVTLRVLPPLPQMILSVNPGKATMPKGQSSVPVTLSWSEDGSIVNNGGRCIGTSDPSVPLLSQPFKEGVVGWNGSSYSNADTVNVSNSTTFTLTCTNEGGTASKSATVTVIGSNPSLLQQVTSFVTGLFGGGSTQPAATQSNQQQTQKVTQTNSFMFRPVNVSQADRDAMAQRLNQKKVNATKTDRENMAKRLQHLNINGQ